MNERMTERRSSGRVEIAGVSLTPRQMEVFLLRVQGLSNQEVVDALRIAVKTVEHHLQAVREAAREAFPTDSLTEIMTRMVVTAAASGLVVYDNVPGAVKLTSSELKIAVLKLRGVRNSGLADEFVISDRTVEEHVAHIDPKLGGGGNIGNLERVGRLAQVDQSLSPSGGLDGVTSGVNIKKRIPLYPVPIIRAVFDRSMEVENVPEEIYFTVRELQVATMMFSGENRKQMADECGIELKTVEAHLTNIYGKLGAAGRSDAVAILAAYLRDGKKVVTRIGLAGLDGGERFGKTG